MAASLDGRPDRDACSGRRGFDRLRLLAVGARSPSGWRACAVDRLVYDCIDPCVHHARTRRRSTHASTRWRARPRLVLCTAQTLLERMQRVHPEAHLLDNAASPELYESASVRHRDLPEPLARATSPGRAATWAPSTDALDVETVAAGGQGPARTTRSASPGGSNARPGVPGRPSCERCRTSCCPARFRPRRVATVQPRVRRRRHPVRAGVRRRDALNPVKMYMYLLQRSAGRVDVDPRVPTGSSPYVAGDANARRSSSAALRRRCERARRRRLPGPTRRVRPGRTRSVRSRIAGPSPCCARAGLL